MNTEEIKEILEQKGECELEIVPNCHPECLLVPKDKIQAICELLKSDKRLYFDMLSCLTALDNGVEADSMEVIYHLYSIPNEIHLGLKVVIERSEPTIDSVSEIWQTANWHEREAFDLLGIRFEGHPDLRRILLPEDWEGHPLKKDYEHQEKYHGIKVAY